MLEYTKTRRLYEFLGSPVLELHAFAVEGSRFNPCSGNADLCFTGRPKHKINK